MAAKSGAPRVRLPRFRPRGAATALPPPEQRLVPKWADLIREAEAQGNLQIGEPEPGVVLFAWYYDKYGVHELGAQARDKDALIEYQAKIRMRERSADSARKAKMKEMAEDAYFRYAKFLLSAGAEHTRAHPRNFASWDVPVELKKWLHHQVVECYAYVDRERVIKRLYDRLDEEGYTGPTSVPKVRRTNRIVAGGKDRSTVTVNVTRACQTIGWEGFGFEEAIETELARGRGGALPEVESAPVELRRAIEGEEFLENEALWEEHGPPALRAAMFELITAAHRDQERKSDDRGNVVMVAYPISTGGTRVRRAAFFDAVRVVRAKHRDQMRGRFYQFEPAAEPPEDLYVTHVVNEWVDDRGARALVHGGKVHLVTWIDSRAMAREVLKGFSRMGVVASTGMKTAELRQRVLLLDGESRRPFDLGYGAQLVAQFGYSFDQAVDLSIIKAFLKVEGPVGAPP